MRDFGRGDGDPDLGAVVGEQLGGSAKLNRLAPDFDGGAVAAVVEVHAGLTGGSGGFGAELDDVSAAAFAESRSARLRPT